MRFAKWAVLVGMMLLSCLSCGAAGHRPEVSVITVGWHDELNDPGTWKSLGHDNTVDAFASQPGALMLRMRPTRPGFGASYQWGGVTRDADVDLGKYPVMVACVSRLQEGSYAHLDVELKDADGKPLKPVHAARSKTLLKPGLTVLDVQNAWNRSVTERLTLRLIVGGSLEGASAEYAWVRFVRREDARRLQAGWNPETIREDLAGDPVIEPPVAAP